jgi:hypothetical protein
MAKEPDALVVRLLREIQAVPQIQDEVLGSISGRLGRLEKRVQELVNALTWPTSIADRLDCLESRQ